MTTPSPSRATTSASYETLRELLNTRHSCRAFESAPVPRDTIRELLESAQRTASWCNTQPWHIIVTSTEATQRYRTALAAHMADHPAQPDIPFPDYEGVYLERRRACGGALYDSVRIDKRDRLSSARQTARNFDLFDAPHVAMITAPTSLGPYALVDCGSYIANFILTAHSLGLGAIPQAALAAHADFVHQHFDIPPDRAVVCGISFGYEDGSLSINRFRTERADLSEAVTFAEQ